MTPREIARIEAASAAMSHRERLLTGRILTAEQQARYEALSLELREETLAARSRSSERGPYAPARTDDRRRRSSISAETYAAIVEAARRAPDASIARLASEMGRSPFAVSMALGRARRCGDLPPVKSGRRPSPTSRRAMREAARPASARPD